MKDIREEYQAEILDESGLLDDPLQLAKLWIQQAIDASLPVPNAMTLATANSAGQPSCRIVLVKDVEPGGLVFFSHYDSRKGVEMSANPNVAGTLFWEALSRQITFTGQVQRLSADESSAYFASRPRGSQLSAAISPQSQPVISRAWLESRQQALAEQLGDDPVPRPENWGGYLIVPQEMQFWHGRPDRLHDRFRYLRQADNGWHCDRLAP